MVYIDEQEELVGPFQQVSPIAVMWLCMGVPVNTQETECKENHQLESWLGDVQRNGHIC